MWCLHLEKLYHQRVLHNLNALQEQWGNTYTHMRQMHPQINMLWNTLAILYLLVALLTNVVFTVSKWGNRRSFLIDDVMQVVFMLYSSCLVKRMTIKSWSFWNIRLKTLKCSFQALQLTKPVRPFGVSLHDILYCQCRCIVHFDCSELISVITYSTYFDCRQPVFLIL